MWALFRFSNFYFLLVHFPPIKCKTVVLAREESVSQSVEAPPITDFWTNWQDGCSKHFYWETSNEIYLLPIPTVKVKATCRQMHRGNSFARYKTIEFLLVLSPKHPFCVSNTLTKDSSSQSKIIKLVKMNKMRIDDLSNHSFQKV